MTRTQQKLKSFELLRFQIICKIVQFLSSIIQLQEGKIKKMFIIFISRNPYKPYEPIKLCNSNILPILMPFITLSLQESFRFIFWHIVAIVTLKFKLFCQIVCKSILRERRNCGTNREYICAMIYQDFKLVLNEEQCMEKFWLAFGIEAPFQVTISRLIAKFHRERSYLHTERTCSTVHSENVALVHKMIF